MANLPTKKPEPTVEEQLEEARAEIGRLERKLSAANNAIKWWVRHFLALHDGRPCRTCK